MNPGVTSILCCHFWSPGGAVEELGVIMELVLRVAFADRVRIGQRVQVSKQVEPSREVFRFPCKLVCQTIKKKRRIRRNALLVHYSHEWKPAVNYHLRAGNALDCFCGLFLLNVRTCTFGCCLGCVLIGSRWLICELAWWWRDAIGPIWKTGAGFRDSSSGVKLKHASCWCGPMLCNRLHKSGRRLDVFASKVFTEWKEPSSWFPSDSFCLVGKKSHQWGRGMWRWYCVLWKVKKDQTHKLTVLIQQPNQNPWNWMLLRVSGS